VSGSASFDAEPRSNTGTTPAPLITIETSQRNQTVSQSMRNRFSSNMSTASPTRRFSSMGGALSLLVPELISTAISTTRIGTSSRSYVRPIRSEGRFHETWNGSQLGAERWLTAYTAYYNHRRNHQALDNQPPVDALKQNGSI